MAKTLKSPIKSAVKGTTIVFIGSFANLILWFAIKILITNHTTTEQFGLYTLVFTIAMMTTSLVVFGLPAGASRYISVFLGKEEPDNATSVSRASLQMGFISSMTSAILLYFLAPHISKHVFYMPEIETPIRIIAFSIPFGIMAAFLRNILRGYHFIKHTIYCQELGQPVFFMVLTGALFLFKLPFPLIFLAHNLSVFLVFLLFSYYSAKLIDIKPLHIKNERFYGDLLKFSIPLFLGSLMRLFLTWTDTLMLGRYTDVAEVGIYNVSISLAKLLLAPLQSLGFVILPIAGSLYGKKQFNELNRSYQVLTRWIFSAAFPIFFVEFFFPEMLITFLFGERFLDSSLPLQIMAVGFLFHTLLGNNGVILTAIGKTRHVMYGSILSGTSNIILNYVLIKSLGLGVKGAAIATVLSYSLHNIYYSIVLYATSGIHPFTLNYIRPVAGSAVIGIVMYIIVKSLPFHMWMLPLYGVMFLGIYIVSIILTRSIDKEDLALFEEVSRKTGLEMAFLRKFLLKVSR
jgi:O-antigen/teichoic acid export membrane protein